MTDTVRLAATLRPATNLQVGDYRLRTDRCVVELAALGPGPIRGRIEPTGGTLTVDDLNTLELDLLPESLPFLRGWLATGLTNRLALKTRVVHADEETVVLTATGRLPRRWTRVTLAAEFTR